nr:MAG TPA: hypothetical protein [Caudoviricetes sp.]
MRGFKPRKTPHNQSHDEPYITTALLSVFGGEGCLK